MACSNKVVLVTGGASGIGACCVDELLKNGARGIVIADINSAAGEETTNKLNAKYGRGKVAFVKTDVSNKDSLEAAFRKTVETYKNIDILVHCAAIIDEYNWERAIQINLVGAANANLLAVDDYLPKYKSGAKAYVVNIASIVCLVPFAAAPVYSASKTGVLSLTRAYAANRFITDKGISLMALCPGVTETPMYHATEEKIIYKECFREILKTTFTIVQPASILGEALIKALNEAENGDIYLVSDNKINKVEFPSLEDMLVP